MTKVDDKADKEPLYLKLLEVCINEKHGDIVDAMPMFLATILVKLPEKAIPEVMNGLTNSTIDAHRDYLRWVLQQ